MRDLSAIVGKGRGASSGVSSYLTLANTVKLARAAAHSVEIAVLNYPLSHQAILHSFFGLLRKTILDGNGIRQRDLIMPPVNLNGYHADDRSGVRGRLDSDLDWFYRHSGTQYYRFGNLITFAGRTACEIDYFEKKALFKYGASHELEPLLKQRGFEVSYTQSLITKM